MIASIFWFPQAAKKYCPHHVGHYLGMDVHDTPDLSRSQPLQPGMAITIEPGKPVHDQDIAPHTFTYLKAHPIVFF